MPNWRGAGDWVGTEVMAVPGSAVLGPVVSVPVQKAPSDSQHTCSRTQTGVTFTRGQPA